METIFYVLFRSSEGMHDFMEFFDKNKTLQDYMYWQHEKRKITEGEFGSVVVRAFDIKRNTINK